MQAYGDIARVLLPWLDPPSRHALGLTCRSWWHVYREIYHRPGGPLTVITRDTQRTMVTGEAHGYGVYPRRTAIVYRLPTTRLPSPFNVELCRCEMTADGYAMVYGEGGIEDVRFKAHPVENIFRDLDDIQHYRYELTKISPPPWTWGLPVHPNIQIELLDDLVDAYRQSQIHPYLLRELCALMRVDDHGLGRTYDDWQPLPTKRAAKRRRIV